MKKFMKREFWMNLLRIVVFMLIVFAITGLVGWGISLLVLGILPGWIPLVIAFVVLFGGAAYLMTD